MVSVVADLQFVAGNRVTGSNAKQCYEANICLKRTKNIHHIDVESADCLALFARASILSKAGNVHGGTLITET